ncbi:hypothetical protein M0804_001672 [Polistes exclamans]|nr:hypothetical protein M0804_001672 [Polistes exclamans]
MKNTSIVDRSAHYDDFSLQLKKISTDYSLDESARDERDSSRSIIALVASTMVEISARQLSPSRSIEKPAVGDWQLPILKQH